MNEIIKGNCLIELKKLEDQSVNCCVTSPPYWGLRDYDHDDQLGQEKTPEEYVKKLVDIFREVKRVLKDDGTLWLNLGDSYYSNFGGGSNSCTTGNKEALRVMGRKNKLPHDILKPKDLVGIPWMVAFALRADGWYLRQDIIWHKPNPMPESVTDRCTKSHEYIFLMSKSKKYYYDQDAIKTPLAEGSLERLLRGVSENHKNINGAPGSTAHSMSQPRKNVTFGGKKGREYIPDKNDPNFRNGSEQWGREYVPNDTGMANKKSVWTVSTKPFKDAHFATFPQELIVDCIKAGCPEDGVVLDPFMGAGTTALVARKLNRNYIGFELNESYIKIANQRLNKELGMFI